MNKIHFDCSLRNALIVYAESEVWAY